MLKAFNYLGVDILPEPVMSGGHRVLQGLGGRSGGALALEMQLLCASTVGAGLDLRKVSVSRREFWTHTPFAQIASGGRKQNGLEID